jgi:RNA-binding motif X-linked protein 2
LVSLVPEVVRLLIKRLRGGDDVGSESEVSSGPDLDPEDPMYEYLVSKRKEEKMLKKAKKSKSSSKRKDETPDERRARKEKKRAKKEKKKPTVTRTNGSGERRADQEKTIDELLRELEEEGRTSRVQKRSSSDTPLSRIPLRSSTRSPSQDDHRRVRLAPTDRGRPSRSRSPPGRGYDRLRGDESDISYRTRR